MRKYRDLMTVTILVGVTAFSSVPTAAQDNLQRLPPRQISIDEDILAAFIDEPCNQFEAAQDRFVAGQFREASEHLRKASAYLRLEAARGDAQDEATLHASVRELQALSVATERGDVPSVNTLQQAFARAHYALAAHHCVKTAHRCCRPATFADKQEVSRAGHDLRAAAIHLERGSQWAGTKLDEETELALQAAKKTADNLLQRGTRSQNEIQQTIHNLHGKLEKLTGRKITVARPLTPDDDKEGPSVFR